MFVRFSTLFDMPFIIWIRHCQILSQARTSSASSRVSTILSKGTIPPYVSSENLVNYDALCFRCIDKGLSEDAQKAAVTHVSKCAKSINDREFVELLPLMTVYCGVVLKGDFTSLVDAIHRFLCGWMMSHVRSVDNKTRRQFL